MTWGVQSDRWEAVGYNLSGNQGGETMGIASDRKVSDLTLGELKELIREVILETLDPDLGLELRDEAVRALEESFGEKERGEGIPLEEAERRLGLR